MVFALTGCNYGMKDWYGNSVPGIRRCKRADDPFVFGTDEDGKRYWLHDGIRDYELPYLKMTDTRTGTVLYDSRCAPPPPDTE